MKHWLVQTRGPGMQALRRRRRMLGAVVWWVFATAVHAAEPLTGKASDFHGCALHEVTVAGREIRVLRPEKPRPGHPWVMAMQLYSQDRPEVANLNRLQVELVRRGFHVVAASPGGMLGSPDAEGRWLAVHRAMSGNYGLAVQCGLMGMSREGLTVARWAAEHPGKVAWIYLDKAVCDFKSWPGGKIGIGKGNAHAWASLMQAYGFRDEAEALAYAGNPVDLAPQLVAAKVAILYLAGGRDTLVPLADNGARLEAHYRTLGGTFELIVQERDAHHPHGLGDPAPVLEFIERQSGRSADLTSH